MRPSNRTSHDAGILAVATCCFALAFLSTSARRAEAQTEGYNAICNSSSCNGAYPSEISPSPSTIDASVFGNSGDVCAQIRLAFGNIPLGATGITIDARGVQPSSPGAPFACTGTPWYSGSGSPNLTPSVILLPAGQISMSQTWIIPSQTRVFGAGVYGSSKAHSATGYGTYLVCNSSCTLGQASGVPPAFIQFGGYDVTGNAYCNPFPCTGISVEYLTVDGVTFNSSGASYPQPAVGILNQYGQQGSYVNQVNIINLAETTSGTYAVGLQIGGGSGSASAINSGPYTDIFFQASLTESPGMPQEIYPTECVEIYQSATLGLHGITCVLGDNMASDGSSPAIALDASYTTIKDVHVEDFYDGVRIGANAAAQADTIANVTSYKLYLISDIGSGTPACPQPVNGIGNAVHICGPAGGSGCDNISDLTIMAVAPIPSSTLHDANAVMDDQTVVSTGVSVGLYDLGTAGTTLAGGGRTRFFAGNASSTSSNPIPSWGVGNTSPPSSGCQEGSIYSNTNPPPASNSTIYVCSHSGTWVPIA